MRWTKVIALLGFLLGVAVAQKSSDLQTRLQVSTKVVRVDVSVVDSRGQFVPGLTAGDFQVFEDGKRQSVNSFEEVDPSQLIAPVNEGQSKVAAGEFTNVHGTATVGPDLSIILLDLLNTSPVDQLYARQQLLRFLQGLPAGHNVGLFVLSDRLHLIQNFTSRSDELIAAAKLIRAEDFGLIQGASTNMGAGIFTNFTSAMQGSAGGIGFMRGVATAQAQENRGSADFRRDQTLRAMEELAGAAAGYRGRKSLLWLAGGFPFLVGSQPAQTRYIEQVRPGSKRIANLISESQIAIYPINVRGLQTGALNAEVSGSMVSMAPSTAPSFFARQVFFTVMNDIATETGGEAFYNTNDFAGAMRKSVYQDTHYYSLTYRPPQGTLNGEFRSIRVQLDRKGDTLAYRRGYYAMTPQKISAEDSMDAALTPGIPDVTMLHLNSGFLEEATPGSIRLQSTVAPAEVTFTQTADGVRHARLLVRLVAFPVDSAVSAPIKQTSGTVNVDLDAERFALVNQEGIAFQQQLQLRPGRYELRLGVVDAASQRIGTLGLPLTSK